MAIVLVLAGGVLGFVTGLVSLFVLGLGIVASLAIWSGTGLLFCVIGLAAAMLPRANALRRHTRAA